MISEGYGPPFLNDLAEVIVISCWDKFFNKDCTKDYEAGKINCREEWYICSYRVEEMLQIVEIYFDTLTFSKITKDVKTNFAATLGLIYGVCGLFAGFSILSVAVEVVCFVVMTIAKMITSSAH